VVTRRGTDAGPPARSRRREPLGRHGLILGVLVLVSAATLGGTSLLRSSGRTAGGIATALAPFPGFPQATPARAGIGAASGVRTAYAAIAARGTADWRAQFARAGVDWQDPTWASQVPRVPADRRRARIVLDVGTQVGEWAQQLVGIPGLLEVGHRQGRISPSMMRVETADLAACLAGAWGRSMIRAADLVAVAPEHARTWVARGATTGVPSACAPAAGG
jgi:hypothetical protein